MATTYLSRTPSGAPTSTKIATFSFWFKRGTLGSTRYLYNVNGTGTSSFYVLIASDDKLRWGMGDGSGNTYELKTTAIYKDPAAWYHFVGQIDTPQDSESDRMKIYINGVQLTDFTDELYPVADTVTVINSNSYANYIGVDSGTSAYWDGSIAHMHMIDGTAYAASTFGSTDATSGIWVPNTGPSVTYGNNGFFLKFQDTAAFGDDSSGNTNDFALSGTMTQTKDNPQNNFATLNPLNDDNLSVDTTFAYGNLQVTKSNKGGPTATMGVTKGKWYWEIKAITVGADIQTGIYDPMYTTGKNYVEAHVGASNHGYGLIHSNGNKIHDGSNSSYGSGISADDIIMHALDMDNKKWWAGLNGTWFASGDPAAGTNEAYSTLFSAYTSTHHFITPCIGTNSASETGVYQFNFGNGYFGTTNVTSAVADGDGEGRFEYTPPTGFYALCTNNLATYG